MIEFSEIADDRPAPDNRVKLVEDILEFAHTYRYQNRLSRDNPILCRIDEDLFDFLTEGDLEGFWAVHQIRVEAR